MSNNVMTRWESMRTDETRKVEELLRKEFPRSDAYRYNPASIRVRVIDSRFKGRTPEQRDALVEPLLGLLPEATQSDIVNLLTFYPDEVDHSLAAQMLNVEFEDPSPSGL